MLLWALARAWPDALNPFMRHERWDTALFLHWALPREQVQALLPAGLEVDDGGDARGSGWLGLVLLSELGVGPAGCCRWSRFLVDHHGANLRVYVRGPDGPGILFLSLECSSAVASAGARLFSIPYWPGSMSRTVTEEDHHQAGTGSGSGGGGRRRRFQLKGRRCTCRCRGRSFRWRRFSTALISCSWAVASSDATLATTTAATSTIETQSSPSPPRDATNSLVASSSAGARQRGGSGDGGGGGAARDVQWARRAHFFVEQYRLYTVNGSALYSGVISHQPWAAPRPVELQSLQQSLSNAVPGLAAQLGAPAHCCFSEGTGPIDFGMLRPSGARPS